MVKGVPTGEAAAIRAEFGKYIEQMLTDLNKGSILKN
jgi:hypothetical protein